MKNRFLNGLILSIFAAMFMSLPGIAQVEVDAKLKASGYVQQFDSLPVYGTHDWKDNVTISGWFSTEKALECSFGGQNVTPQPGIYSLGDDTGDPKDRCLGATASVKKRISFGIGLLNKTGVRIDKMELSFIYRQFRGGDATNRVQLWYKVGEPGTIAISDPAGWKELKPGKYENTLTKKAQVRPVAQTSRTVTLSKLSWNHGDVILIRWGFAKNEGTGASIGIDNVIIRKFASK